MGDRVTHNSSDAQGRHKLRPPPILPESGCDLHKPGFRQDLETLAENKAIGRPWRKKGTLLSLILGRGSLAESYTALWPLTYKEAKRLQDTAAANCQLATVTRLGLG